MSQELGGYPTTLVRRQRPKRITAKRAAKSRAAKPKREANRYAAKNGRSLGFRGRSNCNFRTARAPETATRIAGGSPTRRRRRDRLENRRFTRHGSTAQETERSKTAMTTVARAQNSTVGIQNAGFAATRQESSAARETPPRRARNESCPVPVVRRWTATIPETRPRRIAAA